MDMKIGKFIVAGSANGGHPPEFFAEKLCQNILHVADDVPPEMEETVKVFHGRLRDIAYKIICEAIEADRKTTKTGAA